jgi:hypothetical protein
MNHLLSAMIGRRELALIVVALASVAFWIWMIVDCAIHESKPGVQVAWLLILVLGSLIGAPLYYVVRKLPRYWRNRSREGLLRPLPSVLANNPFAGRAGIVY